MTAEVVIRQWPEPIAVEPGATILETALAAGVPYPHGCRSGNCGACKSRLFRGEVEMTPHSEYALTDEERAQGLILACRATAWDDAEVAWLDVDEIVIHPRRQLKCRVLARDTATHDIALIRLEVLAGGPFTFSAGQYAAVTFDSLAPRDYSMASRPDEAVLEFHIRRLAGTNPALNASAYAFDRLAPGESVAVEGPFGTAYLREHHAGPIVAVAGGSGLAPIKSIVETALARGMAQPVHLYFGVRAERDLYLEDHFQALAARHVNFRFVPVLSEPQGEPQGPTKRRRDLVGDAVAADFASLDGCKIYTAGPPVMVEAMTATAARFGARREDVHADAFYTEADKAKLKAAS
jgi:CDP-4-dehydro-6-deoxyglucose reductase/ferredoxin-NAD(P)+ reductase (naphthalene dioxygenase ferredoxin-specific)